MLKSISKKIIFKLLEWEARLALARFKPSVVAVTGSVGKTSTKDAIYTVLARSFHVRKSEKSFNSESGVPLTILGCPTAWSNPLGWVKTLIMGALVLFRNRYPQWLVLEVGADRPGDIGKIARWLRADVVVITKFSQIPVHVEFFASPRDVIAEKSKLLDALVDDGVLILNADDDDVLALKAQVRTKVMTYGFSDTATVMGSHDHVIYEEREGKKFPLGMTAKVNWNGSSIPLGIQGTVGRPELYSGLAAVAVGLSQDLNLIEMAETLSMDHETPNGRQKLIPGIKNTEIIDDTYNSSPVALAESLTNLKNLECDGRKIVALGDMLELGKYTVDAHEKAGEFLAHFADLLITVGVRAHHFADGARRAGFAENKIVDFEDSRKAGKYLDTYIHEGDVVLVKGSQSLRMERTVEEIMAHPEAKKQLLVRQDKEWLMKK